MAKNKRVKSDRVVLLPVESFEQADSHLQQLGDLQLTINRAEHDANDAINEAKLQLAATTKPLQEQIKAIVMSLELFAAANKDAFGKDRSKKLSFGKIGWHKSSSIRIKKTTLQLIKEVFKKRKGIYPALVNIKESVNKNALVSFTDEQLAAVDARRENKDVFYAEPDLPEAVDYE